MAKRAVNIFKENPQGEPPRTIPACSICDGKMVVVVENNSRGDVVNLGSSGSPPAINKRKAETLVLLNEGERLVIGGVTTSTNQNTIRKIPYLGDIPFLGWAFKQREIFEQGREMVVFLTPSVLKGVTSPASSPK